jgi:hypothetical protein
VAAVPVAGATPLVTWRLAGEAPPWPPGGVRGAIVRVVMVGDCDRPRGEVVALLRDQGARHVWFGPREGRRRTVMAAPREQMPAAENVRRVVGELVDKANTRERDALRAAVDEAMDEAGV